MGGGSVTGEPHVLKLSKTFCLAWYCAAVRREVESIVCQLHESPDWSLTASDPLLYSRGEIKAGSSYVTKIEVQCSSGLVHSASIWSKFSQRERTNVCCYQPVRWQMLGCNIQNSFLFPKCHLFFVSFIMIESMYSHRPTGNKQKHPNPSEIILHLFLPKLWNWCGAQGSFLSRTPNLIYLTSICWML